MILDALKEAREAPVNISLHVSQRHRVHNPHNIARGKGIQPGREKCGIKGRREVIQALHISRGKVPRSVCEKHAL